MMYLDSSISHRCVVRCIFPIQSLSSATSPKVLWSDSYAKVYGKKVSVDNAVVSLILQMEKLLSLVEDSQTLKDTLTRFTDTLTKALVAIQECCEAIQKYIQSPAPSTSALRMLSSLLVSVLILESDRSDMARIC